MILHIPVITVRATRFYTKESQFFST